MKIFDSVSTHILTLGVFSVVFLGLCVTGAPAQKPEPTIEDIVKSVKTGIQQRNPTVELLKMTGPKTPAELVEVATVLADLDQPKLAKDYLKKVLDANLDQSQLIDLADRFGPALFVRLSANKDLAPEGAKLAGAVLSALGQQIESPAQLDQLIGQLASPDERTRDEAIVGLRKAGLSAVVPMMEVLSDTDRSAEHKQIRSVLASLGSDAAQPLAAYLESSDPKQVAQAIAVLAEIRGDLTEIRGDDVLIELLAPYASLDSPPKIHAAARAALSRRLGQLPSAPSAAGLLARRARAYLAGKLGVRTDEKGLATLWRWDAEKKRAVAQKVPLDVARAVLAARLAQQALNISPTDEAVRRLYVLATLEAAAYETGLDRPLATAPGTPAARAAEFGPALLLDVLQEALSTDHGPAATAIAQILGDTATADEVLTASQKPSPLVLALRSPDRRTRSAAVEAIVRLKPTKPFAGSNYLTESMAFLAGSTGVRRAMVASPSVTEARRIGGFLTGLGYEVETAQTGREMLQRLTESPDHELVMIDARIDRPPVGILLQQLRRDGRTAALPVGVVGAEGFIKQSENAADQDPLAIALVRPHDEKTILGQVEQLKKLAGRRIVPAELRRQQASVVLGQLAQLADAQQGLFDLQRVEQAALGAAWSPELSGNAIGVLEKLGTPESQAALVDLASNRTQPLELRKAALAALINTVERNGILLTTDEILLQYARYNQSKSADRETQQILGMILDCLEANSKGK